MQPPTLLTPEDVAKQLDVTERVVRDLRTKRRIEFIRVGNKVRFTQEQVNKFLASATVAAKS
jgi:excisionase family DNA binding protein